MKITNTILLVALVTFTLYGVITWTGVDHSLTAYIKGDYTTAITQFRNAAEQGDAEAQHHLALMYSFGKGVLQNDAEAIKWYRKAAEQGYADAQYNLSMAYYFGVGVPKNYVTAYQWILLSEDHGGNNARDAMPKLAEKMSHEQVATAQGAAQLWNKEHYNK